MKSHELGWIGSVVITIFCVVSLYAFKCNGCEAHDDDVLEAIRSNGMTDPILYGVDLGKCADKETSRRFEAKNPNGAMVMGTVCCGMFTKGCTIRWGR